MTTHPPRQRKLVEVVCLSLVGIGLLVGFIGYVVVGDRPALEFGRVLMLLSLVVLLGYKLSRRGRP